MPSEEIAQATKVLKDFFHAMHEWELYAAELSEQWDRGEIKSADENALRKEALCRVHRQFCTTWDSPSRSSFSKPPSYDPEGQVIEKVEEKKNRIVVYSKETTIPPYDTMVYTLVKYDGGWRLLDERKRVGKDGKLVKDYL